MKVSAAVAVGIDVGDGVLLQVAQCVSTHSVEPSNPGSSPSHAQYMIVRFGVHPCLCSSPSIRASSRTATIPDNGSSAPLTQAS